MSILERHQVLGDCARCVHNPYWVSVDRFAPSHLLTKSWRQIRLLDSELQ